MYKTFLLINTIKYLKWQQIYFRLKRKFIKPKVTDRFNGSVPIRSDTWKHLTLYEEKIDKYFNSFFLNELKQLKLPKDWNNKDFDKLWTYNLHYFEDLLADNAEQKSIFHIQLLNSWIDNNPTGYGSGWDPYPTSLRIVNSLKAWLGGLQINEKIFESLHSQASYLSNDLEKHLLGNHYFVNLKALLFAGVIFKNFHWVKIAEEGLLAQIPEQILSDGANFELSPMYHSLILIDMLDMYNLSRAYPEQLSNKLVSLFEKNIPKMLKFMELMKHPSGGLSFFNDSADSIAPPSNTINQYAQKLGFSSYNIELGAAKIEDNITSGYFCAISGNSKILFDAASIGPDYIPGHAHADTLSFELSIGSERVLVNSGTSEYGLSNKRLQQRKTQSHNTIEVNGEDSSQVWSGFRVAKRARIIERYSDLKSDKSIILKATHDGYKSLFGGCYHSRELVVTEGRLIVRDNLQGNFNQAKSRFYFHPELEISLDDHILLVSGKNFNLRSELSDHKASLFDTVWHPQFGMDISNKCLLIDVANRETKIIFEWTEI